MDFVYEKDFDMNTVRVLASIVLLIAFGIVFHAPLTVWLGTYYADWTNVIKAWKELLMGVALVLFIIAVARRKLVHHFMQDRVMQLALVYAGLHFIMIAVYQNGLEFAGAGLLIDLRYVLFFVLAYGTIQLMPEIRQWFLAAVLGGATVVIGFALMQMFVLPPDILASIGYGKDTIAPFITVDQNPDFVRINSTLRGPNPLGAYIVVIFSLLIAVALRSGRALKQDERLILAISAGAAGLVLGATYSRSSVLGLLLALTIIVWVAASPKMRRRLGLAAGVGLLGIVTIVMIMRSDPTISSIVWHNDPSTVSAVDSNDQHAESLAVGIDRMLVQPFGAGVGSTGSASLDSDKPLIIENQYLFVAHETGWLGVGLFLWLFIEIMRRLWRQHGALALGVFAGGAGLALIGLILPVWVDDTVSIIWWGLAAIAIGGGVKLQGAKHARKSH